METIVLGIFLLPAFFIHEFFGFLGVAIYLTLWAIAIFYAIKYSGQRSHNDFQLIVLAAINGQTQPNLARILNRKLMLSNPDRAELLRSVQIIRDSVDIALVSTKSETAKSRLELAARHLNEVQARSSNLDTTTFNIIRDTVDRAHKEYETLQYINQAEGHLRRMTAVKTEKTREKYRSLAREAILDGLKNEYSDKARLKSFLDKQLKEQPLTRS